MLQVQAIGVLLAASLAAGCGNSSNHGDLVLAGHTTIADGAVIVKNGTVIARSKGNPDAVIDAAGELRIDNKAVSTAPAQQELLRKYYSEALDVRQHGIETGKAGAAVAGQALKSVASGLASGNTDQIDKDVNAKARVVDAAAMKICDDLGNLKQTQDELAAQLPAFAPYAHNISDRNVTECKGHSRD